MNNFEHSQRRWQAPPFTRDVLLIERKTELGRQGTRMNNSIMSSKTQQQERTAIRVHSEMCPSSGSSLQSRAPRRKYKFGIDSKLCRRMLKKSSPMTRLLTQSGQKRSQRSKIRTEGIRHKRRVVWKIETCKRVNMETTQLGPVGVAKDTTGLVKKKKNPKKVTSRIKIRT